MLRYVAAHAPISARDVADSYGAEHGLARTTVTTVLERLRAKGYLVRRRQQGVYRYAPRVSQSDVMQGVVRQFVERVLGGSISPVVAYLSGNKRISDEELEELQQLVEDLKSQRGDRPE